MGARKVERSNCCGAEAVVSSGDEGTSIHLCSWCKKPCDTSKQNPTSHVIVDSQTGNWQCRHCGETIRPFVAGYYVKMDTMTGFIYAFSKSHKNCKPKPLA